MSVEKLKQAMSLIQECIDEYQGEEDQEGEGDNSNPGSNSGSSSMSDMGGNDKVKMAAALMKRGG